MKSELGSLRVRDAFYTAVVTAVTCALSGNYQRGKGILENIPTKDGSYHATAVTCTRVSQKHFKLADITRQCKTAYRNKFPIIVS